MELENFYENVKEHFECQNERACVQGESSQPESRVQPMEPARRNISLRVIYTLLGVCILLSVVAIVTAVMLRYNEKTPSAFPKLQDEISQLNNTIKNSEQILSSIAKIQDEISQLSKTIKSSEQTLSSIATIQDEISQLRKNTETSIASVKNELSQWKSNYLLRCPTGWTRFRESCYQFSSSENIWVEAQRQCASVDAHLVVINNANEQDFLTTTYRTRHWIGLSDAASEGDWRWVDGTDYYSSSRYWDEGEPNNDKDAEDCVEILDTGKWNDLPCDERRYWICETSALIPSSI
ncbi:uncharacterized protein [Mobula birostris]|uniref:uncharacterized protein isoform X1 n=1 Tax=Mobula birostris TaxID=1983395 RepID=UPI003B27DC12